ncbi:MAG: DNA-directed RNA polymerase subunit omega [Bdellovibrionales bacterium]|nr:DNA-directed RNA polymerase subunit omega [Bdellovibrionales bacterium]
MARISIEDCLEKVSNRFALVQLASERARQLTKGSRRFLESKNKNIVTALREIAAEKITFERPLDEKQVQDS